MTNYTFEGVEKLHNFKDNKALELYRKEALEQFKPIGDFITSFIEKEKINIIEVGSGNSSLLYFLSKKNLIKSGLGIEMAKSRYLFAERWKTDHKFSNVINLNDNFRNVSLKEKYYDIFVCNSTFQYLKKEIASELIVNAYNSLKKNGILIMDVPNYQKSIKKIKNNIYSFKKNLPKSNPFAFAIYTLKKNYKCDNNSYINTSEYFDEENNLKTSSNYIIYPWGKEDISNLLHKKRFLKVDIYGSLNKDSFDISCDNYFIAARK